MALATPASQSHAQGRGALVVWANDGGDKVTRDELRAAANPASVRNSLWDGSSVRLHAARNEVVSFNLVIEAGEQMQSLSVETSDLAGPGGAVLRSAKARSAQQLFDWTGTEIETFYVRYLPILGLSRVSYDTYDEEHVPERLRKPAGGNTGWKDRPGHDKEFPDIAVPIELVPHFDIAARTNQSIWVDVYVPKSAPAGLYKGQIAVKAGGGVASAVPITLDVRPFELPDSPSAKTMVATSYSEVARRYTGNAYPNPGTEQDALVRRVMDRQAMLAHRHRIALIDDNAGATKWTRDEPRPEARPRLDGSLFTRKNGYAGPGEGVGAGVYSVGTYGSWQSWWGSPTRENMVRHASAWESWFQSNMPDVERFLYLADETTDYAGLERWAGWLKEASQGPILRGLATIDLLKAQSFTPSLDIVVHWSNVGPRAKLQEAADRLRARGATLYVYNGVRPASGSFAIEDDGVALREIPWAQYKKGITRWFYWNATYYSNYQGGLGDTDLFSKAQTFGGPTKFDANTGQTGWNSSNGDGVLFYPGTDAIFSQSNYGIAGPIASLRLKQWRRGIQDVDYITLAAKKDPSATAAIVRRMVPKAIWEVDVADLNDPTWVRGPISWSTRPDDWEAARAELASIIETPQR